MLRLASQGLTDQSIAGELGLSLATVGTYWGRVRIKMGPLSRTELVARYLQEEADQALESLRERNRELAAKLAERERHERDTRETLATLEALLCGAPEAILIVDADGVVRMANAQAGELFGWAVEEFVGARVGSLIPAPLHEAHRQHRLRYMADPHRMAMGEHNGVPALRKDGSEIRVSATLNVVHSPTGPLAVCVVRGLGTGGA